MNDINKNKKKQTVKQLILFVNNHYNDNNYVR